MGKKLSVSDGTTRPTMPVLAKRQPAGELAGLVPELGGGGQDLALRFGGVGDFFAAPPGKARIREAVDLLTPARLATSPSVGTPFATATLLRINKTGCIPPETLILPRGGGSVKRFCRVIPKKSALICVPPP